jgi:hypothetical protein
MAWISTGPKSFKVTGDLTMHNITKPIVLDVTFHGAGYDPFSGKDIFVGFDAKGIVRRSEFGLGKYVPIVSDETTITISAEFKKRSIEHSWIGIAYWGTRAASVAAATACKCGTMRYRPLDWFERPLLLSRLAGNERLLMAAQGQTETQPATGRPIYWS